MGLRVYAIAILLSFRLYPVLAQDHKYQFSQLDISNGLSQNQVNCIFKDHQGFMWFGTLSGLNRYDGYTFKVFKHDAGDPKSISDDYIVDIFDGPGNNIWIGTRNGFSIYSPGTGQFNNNAPAVLKRLGLPNATIVKIQKDSRGYYWFVFANSGVYRYNPNDKRIYHYSNASDAVIKLYSNNVTDITEDSRGNMWLVYAGGFVEKINAGLNKIVSRISTLYNSTNNKALLFSFTIDSDNALWFFAPGSDDGVYYLNPQTNSLKHIDKDTPGTPLKSNLVNNIEQADNGDIWIATDHGGINVIDKKNLNITYLLHREDDNKSLRQNSVVLYKDYSGIMWAGTFKEGISYYHENIIRFPLYRHFAADPRSLSFEDVDKFVEDKQGNLWIGTNGGGLIYFNRKAGTYTQYKSDPNNPNSLSSDVIVSLCIDHNQKLWIGTYFGGLDSFDGKTFTRYRHNDKQATSLSDDRVWSILEDSSNRLWIGTFAGGLDFFDRDKNIFYHTFKPTEIRSPYVSSIFEDKYKNLWVGGYAGVDVVMSGHRFAHYTTSSNPRLVGDNVNSITQDSRGLIWIATRDGVDVFDEKSNRFTALTKREGLPDNLVLNILEDNSGKMWLSTDGGICRVALTKAGGKYNYQLKTFDEADGLQGKEFNVNAALKTRKGELIFGGGHGFNLFDPLSIQSNAAKPKLVFTDFQLFNRSVAVNSEVNGHVILAQSISTTNKITLNHSDNVFTIEFAALNFFNPNKVKYQYMLQGFDNQWITADNNTRKATYTNLDAGEYIFKVRAANPDNTADHDMITLKIHVKPPFLESPMAYVCYAIIILGILLFIRRRGIQKIRSEFALKQEKMETQLIIEQERQEIERMHDIDKLKTKFLTNVSHEFRTPLSLIMAPVDKMYTNAADAEQKLQLNMIRKNARRLLNLVNQLLDFRKMEVQELKLHTKPGDIIKFIEEISYSFSDIADEKGIGFVFDTEVESLKTNFDHDKIERILFNLLSNAFKFTPRGGHVSVLLNVCRKTANELIEIKVIDTGIGIAKDKHERIFERFFQNNLPGSMLNQGSGIGLAITREFVSMHHGNISVESQPDHGSCFIIHLPVLALADLPVDDTIEDVIAADDEPGPETNTGNRQKTTKKQTVLLVEDNDDFRFYLKDNLKDNYQVIEAINGKEGWQKALALHPDIMVSDISMPEMNGKELCRKIKNDSRTSHIPIILLTALIGEEEELKGLEIGANDYMTKPFNFEILISKIRNLLSLQATFKKTYTRQLDVQSAEPVLPSTDEKFVKEIIRYIGDNMLNPALSVNELSRHMGMNRNTLYKKLLTITGKSPVEYIRSLRLKKAAHLLEHSQMNIAEVSYEVGFNTPQYFARSFKDEFNMLPSEFVQQKRAQYQPNSNV